MSDWLVLQGVDSTGPLQSVPDGGAAPAAVFFDASSFQCDIVSEAKKTDADNANADNANADDCLSESDNACEDFNRKAGEQVSQQSGQSEVSATEGAKSHGDAAESANPKRGQSRFETEDAVKPEIPDDARVAVSTDSAEYGQNEDLPQQLLLDAINAANNMIVISDLTRKDDPLVFANNYFCEHLGYHRSEIVGQNCRFLQKSPSGRDVDQCGNLEKLREAMGRRESVCVQLRNYKKSGEEFINELFLSPVRGESGEVTHYIGVQNDITGLARVQTQLHRESRRFEMVLDAAPAMVGLVRYRENRWEHVVASRRLAEFVGIDRHEVEGRTFDELGFSEELGRELQAFCEDGRQARLDRGAESEDAQSDRVRFFVDVAESPRVIDARLDYVVSTPTEPSVVEQLLRETDIAIGERDLDLWCYILEDMTSLVETTRELEEMQDRFVDVQATEQRRIGRDLHDGVAQEMLATAMYCKALQQKYARIGQTELAGELAAASEMASRSVSRTRRAIRGLLPDEIEMSNLAEALGVLVAETNEALRLAEEVDSMDSVMQSAADRAAGLLELPCRLIIEQEVELNNQTQLIELYRIVAETLANARKHAHAEHITVRLGMVNGDDAVSRAGAKAYIEVEDDGRGMPEAVAEGRNYGFGLRSVGIRATRVGGEVSVRTKPGEGTCVRTTFDILPVDKLTHDSTSVNEEDSRIRFSDTR